MKKARAYITCGLGFGDEGKGSIIDFLVRAYGASSVIKFSGGPQAAHYVTAPDGREHAFSQFGSGTFVPGVRTHISCHMLIKPQNLIIEEEELRKKGVDDAFDRLSIDPQCCIVTPYHAMLGQMLETSRGKARYGSVGMGVGQAALERDEQPEKSLRLKDLIEAEGLGEKLKLHREKMLCRAEDILSQSPCEDNRVIYDHFRSRITLEELEDSYHTFVGRFPISFISDESYLDNLVSKGKTIVFEASQGALIDFHYGFWPYVTKTDTTKRNAEGMVERFKERLDIKRIGILRYYNYRHGPGPLVSEDIELSRMLPESHNRFTQWQGDTRKGWLDLLSARYAAAINPGLSGIALTHIDSFQRLRIFRICVSYEYLGRRGDLLDKYFTWEIFDGDRIRITAIRPALNNRGSELTDLLFECAPLDFLEFLNVASPAAEIRSIGDISDEMMRSLRLLESKDGLGLPVDIVSFGPGADQKIIFHQKPSSTRVHHP